MSQTDTCVHVAIAVIVDEAAGRVLLSRRSADAHQGGLWEFPGGKVEASESVVQALARELDEELGICPLQSRPLIRIRYDYPDRSVLLDVWRVTAFDGIPSGREGQPVEWVDQADMPQRAFPAANAPILKALGLPDRYLITPDRIPGEHSERLFLEALERSLHGGVRLLQLRITDLENRAFVTTVVDRVHHHGGKILINGDVDLARALGADGVHLNSQRLRACSSRPVADSFLLAASCHNPEQLLKAAHIDCDFALLSPVAATTSHPETRPLGWERFQQWVDTATLPVYALGGMTGDDLDESFRHGGQGIAAISGLWGR